MSIPLLSTKFNIPAPAARLVPRPRLIQTLDEALLQGVPLILVCGPAGYGKTTLVSQWLHASPHVHPEQVAWLTLDPADDDLPRFLAYLIAALQRLHPGFGEAVLNMLHTHKPQPPAVLATLLINELSELPVRLLLVLDDYHLITSQPVQSFIGFLVDHQPPQLCLLLLTRSDPPLPMARLRARRQLVELRQDTLCFLPAEVAEFADKVMHLDLSPEQVTFLARHTEGWISGLQLAAISLSQQQDRVAFFSAFSGEHAFIADYLAEEVLSRLSAPVRQFLLHTAILERLTAPLCEAVTGQPGAQAMLQQLLEANLFILPLDDHHTWYRYHVLFADLLRKRLYDALGADVSHLHRRASAWFAAHDLLDLAIEHAIVGEDFITAASLIAPLAEQYLSRGQAATLLRWLEALPPEALAAHPALLPLKALALFLCSRPPQQVRDLLQQFSASRAQAEFQGELFTLQALLAVLQGQSTEAARLSAQALHVLPEARIFFRSLAADSLGMAMQELFEGTLGALEKLTNPLLVERWRARGRAAFRPSSQNLRILSDLLPADDEAAALMALLRETHNLSGAIQTAQDYPNAVPVLVQLGLCHLTVDPAQGLKAVNRAAEIDATHPFVLAVLAMMLQRNGYLVEALEAWETALEIWEDEPQWQAKAASLASEVGDLVCAIDHWEKATALEPAQLDFLAELSKVYLEDGKSEQAMGLLEQATAADDSRADLWYLLAQANRHANYLQQALACAEKACSLDEAAVQPLLLCGEIALQMGNPDLALEYAHKALASQPANEAAVLFQVKVNEWNGKPEEGLNLLEKSITPDSSVMMVLAYTRLVFKQRGAQAALPMLKKIAETDPDEVGVLNLLARAQEECGEVSGAEQTAYQALQLQPNQPDMNLLMGRLKRREGQLDQSVHYLSEAIRQEPGAMDAYLELGKTYVDRREMVQALHTYEKAIKADLSDHRPYYQAGIVLRESKDYIGAEGMLRRAAELAPQDINIRRLLGAVITLNLIHNSQEVGTINEPQ